MFWASKKALGMVLREQEGSKVHYRDERGPWYPRKVSGSIVKDVPYGFCRALVKPTRGPAAFQSLRQLLLGFADAHVGLFCLPERLTAFAGFAEAHEGPCFSPERPRAFAGLCRCLGRALLPSKVSVGFSLALLKPARGPAAFQNALRLLPALPRPL